MNGLVLVGAIGLAAWFFLRPSAGGADQAAVTSGEGGAAATGAARNVRLTDGQGRWMQEAGGILQQRDGTGRGWNGVNSWSPSGERTGWTHRTAGWLEEQNATGTAHTGNRRPISDFYE